MVAAFRLVGSSHGNHELLPLISRECAGKTLHPIQSIPSVPVVFPCTKTDGASIIIHLTFNCLRRVNMLRSTTARVLVSRPFLRSSTPQTTRCARLDPHVFG